MWELILWTSPNRSCRFEFNTKEEAYLAANHPRWYAVVAVEIYGPNGEYDAV